LFKNPDLIRSVLTEAQNITGRDPFVFQQTAIFEMNHDSGSLSKAGELLSKAEQLSPHSLSIKHSMAEVQLRLAERSNTTLQKEKCLSKAEAISSSMINRRSVDSPPYHTICKVNLIRLEDAISSKDEDVRFSLTIEKIVSSIEKTLSEGLQRFPENPHLLDAESRLANLLNDSARALNALQRAFETNRRNSWFAIRISRVFQRQGKFIDARDVLKKALEAYSNNNYLHYTYARLILSSDKPDSGELIFHLRRSFSPGDVNYDAQLLYGRQLYLSGEINDSKKCFKELGKARMAPEQMNRIRYPVASKYYGTVMKQEISYLFIQGDGTTDWIFAHRSKIGNKTWDSINPNDRVSFKLGFTMKGPNAFKITKI
jgi:tetratricopeptide (TPR) repeat protein